MKRALSTGILILAVFCGQVRAQDYLPRSGSAPASIAAFMGTSAARGLDKDVWISVYPAGTHTGIGTPEDPFNAYGGLTDAFFTANIGTLTPTHIHFHLTAGTFQKPIQSTWTLGSYCEMSGAGEDKTIAQFIGPVSGTPRVPVIGGTGDYISVHDLSADANYSALSSTATTGSGGEKLLGTFGVILNGSHCTEYNIHNYGNYGSLANLEESFGIGFSPNGADAFDDHAYNCLVDGFAGNYGSPYALLSDPTITYNITDSSVHDCVAYGLNNGTMTTGNFTTGGVNGSNMIRNRIYNNRFVDCESIFHCDTGTLSDVSIYNNTLVRGTIGVNVTTFGAIDSLNIENNVLRIQNRAVSGAVYAFSLGQNSSLTNLVCKNNLIRKVTGGSGTADWQLFGAGTLTSPVIEDNPNPDNIPSPNQHAVPIVQQLFSPNSNLAGAFHVSGTASASLAVDFHTFTPSGYTIQTGDVFLCDVLVGESTTAGIGGVCTAIYFTDASVTNNDIMSDGGLAVSGDIGPYATMRWFTRKQSLAAYVGKTVQQAELGVGSTASTGTYDYYFRNCRIVSATGALRKSYFTGSETPASAVQTNVSGTVTERARISSGVLNLPSYTVSTLPAGTLGDAAFVTDATSPTFGGTLTGGGSVKTIVFYNGSAWVSE